LVQIYWFDLRIMKINNWTKDIEDWFKWKEVVAPDEEKK
jgi:hypothetical protein